MASLAIPDVCPQPEPVSFDARLFPHFSILGIPHDAPAGVGVRKFEEIRDITRLPRQLPSLPTAAGVG